MGHSFKEIEHKFIVPAGFDRAAFLARLAELKPRRMDEVQVQDTYFVLRQNNQHVFRHRFDRELQQLTVKSVGESNFERTEINLDLVHGKSNQREAVHAFLDTFGVAWSKTLDKDVAYAVFDDCEIVHYRAQCGDRHIECVEFEATGFKSGADALPVLNRYETKLGFAAKKPAEESLFQLLLLADAPQEIVNLFRK